MQDPVGGRRLTRADAAGLERGAGTQFVADVVAAFLAGPIQ